MLDGLVLADRAAEHDAFAGVTGGARQRGAADADGLGGDQDSFRVQTMQDGAEPLAFLADAVFDRAPRMSSKNTMLLSTAWRPILWISRTSAWALSRSV